MERYRVSLEDTFCRDVEVEAESEAEAIKKAPAADWYEQDWCDGHEPRVIEVSELTDEE